MKILAEANGVVMSAPTSGASLNTRLAPSFQHLSSAATTFNRVSDELGTTINAINQRLNQLRIGVSAWVTFAERKATSQKPVEITFQIGYARTPKDSWGIAIRTVVDGDDAEANDSVASFNDVPRDLRLKAIHKLPDLIEALTKEIEDRISEVTPGVEILKEFEHTLTEVIGIPDDEVPF